jgi:hypothetical protein
MEVASEMSARYGLTEILAELTFVFLRVTFRVTPLPYSPRPCLLLSSPPPSLTYVHRFIGYRNPVRAHVPRSFMYTGVSVITIPPDILFYSGDCIVSELGPQ